MDDVKNPELTKFENSLEIYNRKIGFTSLTHNPDIDRYMKCSREDLQRMSAGECLEVANLLIREATYIQQQINQNNAKINWIQARINKRTTEQWNDFDKYMPFEQKKMCAIQGDDSLLDLYKTYLTLSTQNELVLYIPTYLRALADNLLEISRVKRVK